MDFIILPPKWSNLRTDCCTFLKNENGEPIQLKMKMKSLSTCKLTIRILLKTIDSHPHFFKLFRLDSKPQREETNRSTEITIDGKKDIIDLNFFGIRKCIKEQAIKFIKESVLDIENHEKIFKENSSVLILEINLLDSYNRKLSQLLHEIHIGKPVPEEIEVLNYTPKTIYDGEITIFIKGKNKEESCIGLEIIPLNKKYKSTSQPAKNVIVFNILLNEIDSNITEFTARLFYEDNYSNYMVFKLRRSDPENLKRKSSFNNGRDDYSDNKICRSLSDSNGELKTVDICADRKRQLNEHLTSKLYREIARVGHNFAFGKEETDRMKEIMTVLPVVCILQDDVGDTPLNNAILKGNEDRANRLVEIISSNFPENINLKNSSGHTALILAAACNVSPDFVRKLITCGADLMAVDCDGNTAFNIAIQYQNSDVLRLLLTEAISQNLLNNDNDIVNALLKQTIDTTIDTFYPGLEILLYYFEQIRDELYCETILDYDQLNIYKNFMKNYIDINNDELTPIMENLLQNENLPEIDLLEFE